MSDLARALAFAFRRKGVESMAPNELQLRLAVDLRGFAPEDAKRAVSRALDMGLLEREGESLRPAFDAAAVDIPLNFRPGAHVLDEEAPALPPRRPSPPSAAPPPATPPATATAAAAAHAEDALERAAEDERRRRGLLMSLDVARLVVRRRAGEDVAEAAATLEAALLSAGARAPGGAR